MSNNSTTTDAQFRDAVARLASDLRADRPALINAAAIAPWVAITKLVDHHQRLLDLVAARPD